MTIIEDAVGNGVDTSHPVRRGGPRLGCGHRGGAVM